MAVSLADFYFENGALVKFKGVRIEHMPVGHMRWLIRDMGALLLDLSKEPTPAPIPPSAPGRGMTRQQVDLVVKLIDMKIREFGAKDSSDGGLNELIIANETEAELRASAQEDET